MRSIWIVLFLLATLFGSDAFASVEAVETVRSQNWDLFLISWSSLMMAIAIWSTIFHNVGASIFGCFVAALVAVAAFFATSSPLAIGAAAAAFVSGVVVPDLSNDLSAVKKYVFSFTAAIHVVLITILLFKMW